MRLRSSDLRCILAMTAITFLTAWVVQAQSGSTAVPPRPEVGGGRTSPGLASNQIAHGAPPGQTP